MSPIDRKYTFDMANQPGIRSKPITRDEFVAAASALGLEASRVAYIEIAPKRVRVIAVVEDEEGNLINTGQGFLKHDYLIGIADLLCTEGEEIGEDA